MADAVDAGVCANERTSPQPLVDLVSRYFDGQ
jgi:hypothetical protein